MAMKNHSALSSIDWAKRVNRSWLVRGDINEHAAAWMEYLSSGSGERLRHSCENARILCAIRDRLDDPKPWFYAGLFSLATAAEAAKFLATHRITKAAIDSMAEDEDVNLWIDRVGPETRELLDHLRQAIARLPKHPST